MAPGAGELASYTNAAVASNQRYGRAAICAAEMANGNLYGPGARREELDRTIPRNFIGGTDHHNYRKSMEILFRCSAFLHGWLRPIKSYLSLSLSLCSSRFPSTNSRESSSRYRCSISIDVCKRVHIKLRVSDRKESREKETLDYNIPVPKARVAHFNRSTATSKSIPLLSGWLKRLKN